MPQMTFIQMGVNNLDQQQPERSLLNNSAVTSKQQNTEQEGKQIHYDDSNQNYTNKGSYNHRLNKAITKWPGKKRRGPPSIAVRAAFDDPKADIEERLTQCFDKMFIKNFRTGRSMQTLICRVCNKSINKLCNMKDHARRHL